MDSQLPRVSAAIPILSPRPEFSFQGNSSTTPCFLRYYPMPRTMYSCLTHLDQTPANVIIETLDRGPDLR